MFIIFYFVELLLQEVYIYGGLIRVNIEARSMFSCLTDLYNGTVAKNSVVMMTRIVGFQ